jgi:hypothetical protein
MPLRSRSARLSGLPRWAQFQAIAESRRSMVRTALGFLPGAGGSDAEAAR